MPKIYLFYGMENSHDVTILASLTQVEFPYLEFTFKKRDEVDSSLTPRQLLNDLERVIFEQTSIKPYNKDAFFNSEDDTDSAYKNDPRHIDYILRNGEADKILQAYSQWMNRSVR